MQNKKTLQESLELFVKGDLLDGENKYDCSSCARKVTALRRVCIGELPNTLVIHAKRFEFDYETMARHKLNEEFQFPHLLDMEPFTR